MLGENEAVLLEGIRGAVVAADRSGQITYCSKEAGALVGRPAEDVVGMPLSHLMPERMRAAHERGFCTYVETGVSRLAARAVRVPALHAAGHEVDIILQVHLIRRVDGADLIVGTMVPADRGDSPDAVRIQQFLQKRERQAT